MCLPKSNVQARPCDAWTLQQPSPGRLSSIAPSLPLLPDQPAILLSLTPALSHNPHWHNFNSLLRDLSVGPDVNPASLALCRLLIAFSLTDHPDLS